MSTFECPIVEFKLQSHPNADSLSIASIKGWECIVKTEDFVNEDLAVYIPIDAVAPADHKLLAFLEGKKVKTRKLRGVISQGVLLPYSSVLLAYPIIRGSAYDIGDNLAPIIGVTKWIEPEVPFKMGSTSHTLPSPEWYQKYTDIENWNNYPDVIYNGEEVSISEKLHGCCAAFSLIDGEYYVFSRNRCLRWYDKMEVFCPSWLLKLTNKYPILNNKVLQRIFGIKKLIVAEKNVWNEIFNRDDKIKKALQYIRVAFNTNQVTIYGEIVGTQDLKYGLKNGNIDFYAFDIVMCCPNAWNITRYLDQGIVEHICDITNIKMCPVLYKGPFKQELLELRNGKTELLDMTESHIREGIVIKPLIPRVVTTGLGRVVLKKVSEAYLMRKNGTDF